jgi:hypothetical protein
VRSRPDLIALLKSFPVMKDGMNAQRIADALGLDEYETSEYVETSIDRHNEIQVRP